MMKIRTSELKGTPLNYAVALALGYPVGVVTAEEAFAKLIEGASDEELAKHAKEYAEIKVALKTRICKIHEDGYKSAQDAHAWNFERNWAVTGPIIERERIAIAYEPSLMYDDSCRWKALCAMSDNGHEYGPTPLIAAMRCYVTSRLGDEVDVPKELK